MAKVLVPGVLIQNWKSGVAGSRQVAAAVRVMSAVGSCGDEKLGVSEVAVHTGGVWALNRAICVPHCVVVPLGSPLLNSPATQTYEVEEGSIATEL